GGLARWHDGAFTVLTTKKGLAHDVVLALAEDAANRIWIGTAQGLSCWHEGKFVRDPRQVPASRAPFSRLAPDRDRLWTAQNGGVFWSRGGQLERPDILGEPSWFSSM